MAIYIISGGTTPWTLADLPAGTLALWLDSSDTSSLEFDGATVRQWLDRSGNGRHAVNSTASFQPTYGTYSLRGVSLVSTANSPARYIDTPAFLPPTDFDFFWVSTSDGLAQAGINTPYDHGHAVLVSGSTLNANWTIQSDNVNFGNSPNTTTHYAAQNTGLTNFQLVGSGANGIATGSSVIGLYRRKSTAELHRNGTQIATSTFSAMNRMSRSLRIGGCIDYPTRGWRGGHAEIVYTTRSLTTDEMERVTGRLAHKWYGAGSANPLPSNHPYKNNPPTK